MTRRPIDPGAAALLTLVAFAIGLTLPDVDLLVGVHRSGVTHSVLSPVLAFARERWRHAGVGVAGGIGVHLSADCFPRAMVGYATVKLPFEGSIGAGWSYVWLGANAVLALALAAWALRRLHHPVVAAEWRRGRRSSRWGICGAIPAGGRCWRSSRSPERRGGGGGTWRDDRPRPSPISPAIAGGVGEGLLGRSG